MTLAAADAKANARTLAEALGVELGTAKHINSQEVFVPPMPKQMMRAEVATFAADAGAGETYQAGDQRYEARIQVSFEIK